VATNKKITELTELVEADLANDDVLAIVDISAGTTHKIQKSTLAAAVSGITTVTGTSPIVSTSTGDTSVAISTGTIPVNKGGTGATTAAAAATALGVGTGDSPQFTAVNVGAASDTTLARASAGNLTVEGQELYRAGGTDIPVADGGTGRSTLTANSALLGNGTTAVQMIAPGTSGNLLTSNGTTWASTAPAAGGAGYFLGGASGATGDTTNGLEDIFRVNSATVDNTCAIAVNTNASATGPLTISTGVTVTVSGTLVVI
tara:strand:- start:278 stop:1057 length:780 start_codon:yes stop_codon:yes gene_type:complete